MVRSPSTISREMKRNRGNQVGYKPTYADDQAWARRGRGRWIRGRADLTQAQGVELVDGEDADAAVVAAGLAGEQIAGAADGIRQRRFEDLNEVSVGLRLGQQGPQIRAPSASTRVKMVSTFSSWRR